MICIGGFGEIAINCVNYMLDNIVQKNELLIIPRQNDSGVDSWQPSFRQFAINNNIKITQLDEIYNYDDLTFISIEFDKIIKTSKFKTDKLYNLHFSALPRYKGMYTSIMPLLNGDSEAGVTLHEIQDGIDTGDIIAQQLFEIEINDTAKDLYNKLTLNAYNLFCHNIKDILENKHTLIPQSNLNSSYYSKNSIDFNNIKINLNKTSFEIHNQLRAFIFKDFQLPLIQNKKINKSILTSDKIGRKLIIEQKNKFILSGIDGYKIEAIKE